MRPEIILGPPGCGKTTTLLRLVDDELASGTRPDRIGYFSFTRRAAHEAVSRACEKFSLSEGDLRYFRTLHSMCFHSLGLTSSDVLEGKKLREFGDWLGIRMSRVVSVEEGSTYGYEPGDRALFMANLARIRCVSLREQYEEFSDDLMWSMVERVSEGLELYKREKGLIDYTDMLGEFVRQDWSPQLDVVFVDEAQDLSLLQWRVVQRLARGARRLVIAGDDDQAIYRWAGAAVEQFVTMEGEARVLGQSWRVPVSVQGVAHEVISRVRHRREKDWSPRQELGLVSRVQTTEEVDMWSGEILVLGRNNFVLRDVAADLRSEGVIFEWRGETSVRQSTLSAVITWERLRAGASVVLEDVQPVWQLMSTGVGVAPEYRKLDQSRLTDEVTLQDLVDHHGLLRTDIWHEALDGIPPEERVYMLRARERGERLTGRPRVRLSTIHGSKGGEADHVVLLRDVARRTWEEAHERPEDECRVWYVGATRARHHLTIVAPSGKMSFDV